jgi:hypothetical protein
MDFNKTVDLIIRDLEEAREIIDDLKNYPGVPIIQIEMAKSKCRNAAEVIALLKNKPNPEKTEDGRRKTEDRRPKTVVVSPEPVAVNPEPVAGSPEPVASPTQSFGGQSANREPGAGGIIADTFDNMHDSRNKRLGSLRDDKDVTDYLKSKPLANLSQAIGLNDRFLFIRELFNGNSESYSQAIIKIDEAKDLSAAKTLMESYAGDKVETEAGKQLFDLVKRKFPADE